MSGMYPNKNGRQKADKAAPTAAGRSFRFDWAILLYPASILAALVVLYTMSRSIERESSVPRDREAAQQAVSVSDASVQSQTPPGTPENRPETALFGQSAEQPGQVHSASQSTGAASIPQDTSTSEVDAVDFANLEGPAAVTAMLRRAVQQGDHTDQAIHR